MEKIKLFLQSEKGKDILTIIIVILMGLGSFELGRLSKESNTNSLKIEYTGQEANLIGSTIDNSTNSYQTVKSAQKANLGEYFASNRGSKYYPINCSAGKSIKQENRIYFSTTSDAEKAGYVLSSSCQ